MEKSVEQKMVKWKKWLNRKMDILVKWKNELSEKNGKNGLTEEMVKQKSG